MAVKVIIEGNLGNEFAFNNEAKKVELKVDNKTIKKQPDGTVYAVPGAGAVEIEEAANLGFADGNGNTTPAAFHLVFSGMKLPINKVGVIKGTNWLVFQAGQAQSTPAPTPTPDPVAKQGFSFNRNEDATQGGVSSYAVDIPQFTKGYAFKVDTPHETEIGGEPVVVRVRDVNANQVLTVATFSNGSLVASQSGVLTPIINGFQYVIVPSELFGDAATVKTYLSVQNMSEVYSEFNGVVIENSEYRGDTDSTDVRLATPSMLVTSRDLGAYIYNQGLSDSIYIPDIMYLFEQDGYSLQARFYDSDELVHTVAIDGGGGSRYIPSDTVNALAGRHISRIDVGVYNSNGEPPENLTPTINYVDFQY